MGLERRVDRLRRQLDDRRDREQRDRRAHLGVVAADERERPPPTTTPTSPSTTLTVSASVSIRGAVARSRATVRARISSVPKLAKRGQHEREREREREGAEALLPELARHHGVERERGELAEDVGRHLHAGVARDHAGEAHRRRPPARAPLEPAHHAAARGRAGRARVDAVVGSPPSSSLCGVAARAEVGAAAAALDGVADRVAAAARSRARARAPRDRCRGCSPRRRRRGGRPSETPRRRPSRTSSRTRRSSDGAATSAPSILASGGSIAGWRSPRLSRACRVQADEVGERAPRRRPRRAAPRRRARRARRLAEVGRVARASVSRGTPRSSRAAPSRTRPAGVPRPPGSASATPLATLSADSVAQRRGCARSHSPSPAQAAASSPGAASSPRVAVTGRPAEVPAPTGAELEQPERDRPPSARPATHHREPRGAYSRAHAASQSKHANGGASGAGPRGSRQAGSQDARSAGATEISSTWAPIQGETLGSPARAGRSCSHPGGRPRLSPAPVHHRAAQAAAAGGRPRDPRHRRPPARRLRRPGADDRDRLPRPPRACGVRGRLGVRHRDRLPRGARAARHRRPAGGDRRARPTPSSP